MLGMISIKIWQKYSSWSFIKTQISVISGFVGYDIFSPLADLLDWVVPSTPILLISFMDMVTPLLNTPLPHEPAHRIFYDFRGSLLSVLKCHL